MRYVAILTAAVIALAPGAFAQTQSPPPSQASPGGDAAADAKFKAADKNSSGALEGAETDAYKASLTQIDTDKDGKISRQEFSAASKSGVIK